MWFLITLWCYLEYKKTNSIQVIPKKLKFKKKEKRKPEIYFDINTCRQTDIHTHKIFFKKSADIPVELEGWNISIYILKLHVFDTENSLEI